MLNSNVNNINVRVGEDGKLHFVDSKGADTVLPFSSGLNFESLKQYSGTVGALPDSILLKSISIDQGEYILIISLGGVKISKQFKFECNNGTLSEIHFKSSSRSGGGYTFCTTLYIAKLTITESTTFTIRHSCTYSSDSLFEAYEAVIINL